MHYKSLLINGVNHQLAVNLTGSGVPTSSTEAELGMFYMDIDTGAVYKFTLEGWKELGGENGYDTTRIAALERKVEDIIAQMGEIDTLIGEGV